MHRAAILFVASVIGALIGSSAVKADTIQAISTGSSFESNDITHWGTLGTNNFSIANGTVATSTNGLGTTIDFALGGPGSTLLQCPASSCTWNGNFAPGQNLLTTFNPKTHLGEGYLDLTFSHGIAGVGFQIEPNYVGKFQAEIFAYDGSTLLGKWFETGGATSNQNNSANFFGLGDFTGTDITSVQIETFNCGGGSLPQCNYGFAINSLKIWENSSYPRGTPTPEPAGLALVGSGLGALGFLRRKLVNR